MHSATFNILSERPGYSLPRFAALTALHPCAEGRPGDKNPCGFQIGPFVQLAESIQRRSLKVSNASTRSMYRAQRTHSIIIYAIYDENAEKHRQILNLVTLSLGNTSRLPIREPESYNSHEKAGRYKNCHSTTSSGSPVTLCGSHQLE